MTTPLLKVPVLNHPGTPMAMVRFARSQVGYREQADNHTVFGTIYGLQGTAWCQIFAWWAAFASGASKLVPKTAYTPAGADWFQRHHQWHHHPHVGDWVYYYHASIGRIGHVGIVAAVIDAHTFVTVEGNSSATGSRTGDGVYQLRRNIASVGIEHGGGFGRPAWVS